jgi:DNA-binding HxlR family transcriptional regulator
MTRNTSHQARECDERLTRVFGLLGKRWSGVILGLLLEGPARFAVIARAIPGISERMLSDRLTELAKAGILDREVLPGPPLGVVYRLTDKGRALGPGLLKLGEWAELHMDRPPQRKPRRSPSHASSKRPATVKWR